MKSLLRPVLAGGLLAATALVLNTGCVDNRASIYIAGVMVLQPPQCTVQADAEAPQWGRGAVDSYVKNSYNSVLLVANQLTPRGEKVQARAETMRIALTAAEVTLLNAAGEQLTCPDNEDCASFSIFGTGVISVSRSDEPAFGLFEAQLIPPIVMEAIRAEVQASGTVTVVASVRVRGQTLGNQDVESGEFIFPIDVTYGGLIAYNNGPCCLTVPGEVPDSTCNPGQDTMVPCSVCSDGDPNNLCFKNDPNATCPVVAP